MNRYVPQPMRRAFLTRREERGNFMVITALILTVLIGMLALVIDIGFAAGQRRFMQNGADAAALAVADLLSSSVSPYPKGGTWPHGIPNYFNVSDATAQAKALEIADKNRNPGLTGRTTNFSVTVEYCVAANDNSFAPQTAGCPSPNHWVTGPQSNGFVPDGAYKVRVTVNSTISTIFGGAIGKSSTDSVGQATAVILGACPQVVATGNIWPVTLWNQQDFGAEPPNSPGARFDSSYMFQLWSANAPRPKDAPNNWKNVLDLSPSSVWCDSNPDDYSWAIDPSNAGMVPTGTTCTATSKKNGTTTWPGTDTSWNRDLYAADSRGSCFTGSVAFPDDISTWLSGMFSGTLAVGMKVPIFEKGGNEGNNISEAITGKHGGVGCGDTYFFDGVNTVDPNHPNWGIYRDVTVFTYDVSNDYVGTNQWVSNGKKNGLGRITLMQILNVRIYKDYSTPNSSEVLGLVISPTFPPDYTPQNCPAFGTYGPGIYGNVVRLGA